MGENGDGLRLLVKIRGMKEECKKKRVQQDAEEAKEKEQGGQEVEEGRSGAGESNRFVMHLGRK